MKNTLIISNNFMAYKKLAPYYQFIYRKLSVKDIFVLARDYIHQRYALLSHPLSGSLKINQNPYKTILLKKEKKLHVSSLLLIENALSISQNCRPIRFDLWNKKIAEDFQLVDLSYFQCLFHQLQEEEINRETGTWKNTN